MKRFCCLVVLTLLCSSAYAGEQISFVIAGHRIHIEASRSCRSPSCAAISISGFFSSRDRRAPVADDDRAPAEPVKAPPAVSSVPAAPAVPAAPPAGDPPVRPASLVAPPQAFKTAAAAAQPVAAPPPPPIAPARIAPPPPPAEKPADIVWPAPVAVPQVAKVSQQVEETQADTPIGDWQTEGKGTVRIARCGRALCGYVLNSSANDKGEAVLINMKADTGSKWTGNVASHDSGDIYYGTMEMTGPNTLRVEACALSRFYCSGNAWSRIVAGQVRLIARQIAPEPRT
jgi:uncharacterized protein (DUF2147 family)